MFDSILYANINPSFASFTLLSLAIAAASRALLCTVHLFLFLADFDPRLAIKFVYSIGDFVCVFKRFRTTVKSDYQLRHVCVLMMKLGSHGTDFHEI